MTQCGWRNSSFRQAALQRVNAIDAGKNQPIVLLNLGEGLVQRLEGLRRRDLNGRDRNDGGAERLQGLRHGRRLVVSARNDNTFTKQRFVGRGVCHGCSTMAAPERYTSARISSAPLLRRALATDRLRMAGSLPD